MNTLPTTFEEYCAFYAKGAEQRKILFDYHTYAEKEKQRHRLKSKKRLIRLKEEREKRYQNGEEVRPKIGRPRKEPTPSQ